jgi:L-ascorbate metabolism protein UlaG (beta-lactamase superfamily)
MATRLRWLGHSCLLFESGGKHVLVDPFLTGNPKAAAKADEVPADLILVSHGHGDHLGDTLAIARRTGAKVVTNYEISLWLQKQGLPDSQTVGMQHGGGAAFPGVGRVKLTLAFHGSALPDGSNGGNPCGFLVTFADGTKVYDAADTGLFGDMRLIGEEGLDLALLPIGDFYTMGPDDALRAVQMLEPRRVVPIHYDTFPPIAQDARAWAERVRAATRTEPVVLQPGDWLDLGHEA